MAANWGFLYAYAQSLDPEFGQSQSEIVDSLQLILEIFPFSGDFDWRLGSIYTAWGRRTATDGHVTFCEEEVPFIIDSKKGAELKVWIRSRLNRFLKIISAEIVRAFLAANVNFGGSGTY